MIDLLIELKQKFPFLLSVKIGLLVGIKNLGKLKRIVAYHVGFGNVREEDLAQIDEVMTMEGSVIAVDASQGQIQLNNAKAIASDIIVDNGV